MRNVKKDLLLIMGNKMLFNKTQRLLDMPAHRLHWEMIDHLREMETGVKSIFWEDRRMYEENWWPLP